MALRPGLLGLLGPPRHGFWRAEASGGVGLRVRERMGIRVRVRVRDVRVVRVWRVMDFIVGLDGLWNSRGKENLDGSSIRRTEDGNC